MSPQKRIFISYRKTDTGPLALYLYDHLCMVFGERRIFRDIDSLPLGQNWRNQIEKALASCKVVVVLIGKNWLTIADERGKRRLFNDDDMHRWEIATALRRSDTTVIPLLAEDAPALKPDDLPKNIRSLPKKQWLRLNLKKMYMDSNLLELDRTIMKALGWKYSSGFIPSTDYYLAGRGPIAHSGLIGRPEEPWGNAADGVVTIQNLRASLLLKRKILKSPIPMKVRGTLFPCALLSSGWWERHIPAQARRIKWRDPVQKWLFYGFDLWGPSWDFSWNFEEWEASRKRPYFIAQLGDGDEVNSLPVLIPRSKAIKLQNEFGKDFLRGIEMEIVGVLGHRKHFASMIDPKALELFGGLLDYSLWVDEDDPKHKITPLCRDTDVYSGYLWKCVAPKDLLADQRLSLNDVYFIWEHTNFASRDAIQYDLDALQRKEEYIQHRFGSGRELVLVQKSSAIVPGRPKWKSEEIYNLLLGRRNLSF